MKKIFIIFMIIFCLLVSTAAKIKKSVFIASASNMYSVFPEIIKKFNEIYPDVEIEVTFASSGKLAGQILNGAPYDLFLSANFEYTEKIYNEMLKNKTDFKPEVYCFGKLILFTRSNKLFKYNNIKDLLFSGDYNSIAIANHKLAPYGKAAIEVFEKLHFCMEDKKIIVSENISQTLNYALQAVDLAFISKSALFSSYFKENKIDYHVIDINQNYYKPIRQGIIIINENNASLKFYNFILSEDAKKILRDFGYY